MGNGGFSGMRLSVTVGVMGVCDLDAFGAPAGTPSSRIGVASACGPAIGSTIVRRRALASGHAAAMAPAGSNATVKPAIARGPFA